MLNFNNYNFFYAQVKKIKYIYVYIYIYYMNIIDNTLNNKMYENLNKNTKLRFVKNKDKIFKKERQYILEKILNTVGITQENKKFYSHEIEESENKCNLILEQISEIEKYFNVSSWSSFKKTLTINKKPLSIVKSLLKEMNIEYTSLSLKISEDKKIKCTTVYNLKL
jgi:hypothetical protein